MEKIIKDLVDQIKKYNDFLDKKVFSKEEIKEEEDNFKDFLIAKEKLKKVLDELNEIPVSDHKKNSKNLIDLHVLLCDLTWYFENLHENLQKIIKHYPYEE